MKSVLISVNPKWCELIASGKKTIEVRKTKPKIETPFNCYIYCTNRGRPLVWGDRFDGGSFVTDFTQTYGYSREEAEKIWDVFNGKVIGEFVCDRIIEVDCDSIAPFEYQTKDYIEDKICFGRDELIKYAGFTRPFGWHISDLVIYDYPKELSEFRHCGTNYNSNPPILSRPPQDWFYVEKIAVEEKEQK